MMKLKKFSAKNYSVFALWLAALAPYLAYASDPRGMATGLFALLGLAPLMLTNVLMLAIAFGLRGEGGRWLRVSFLSLFFWGWTFAGFFVANDFRGNERPTLNIIILFLAVLFGLVNVWGIWINRKVDSYFNLPS